MATINVLDSTGATVTVAKVSATGATTATNALPVTLATDDVVLAPIGAVTETAPATDTASSGLNGRLQRVAQRLTSLIALLPSAIGRTTSAASLSVVTASDDALTGIVTETAPASDTASSGLNGRLQRVAQNLTTINTTLSTANTQLPSTPSGSVQVTITRPANATPYTALDNIGGALTFGTGLSSGQRGMITDIDLEYDVAALPAGMTTCRLYLYTVTPPSALADNSPWDLPSGDRSSFLGYVDIPQIVDLGSTLYVQSLAVNKSFQLAGSANLFAYLVTTAGFTPAGNSEVLKVRLNIIGL